MKHYNYICTSLFEFVIVTFMDIVGRLKLFLDYLGIPVTQFADNCGIPRPTLSQLLNGRNKTVRDEIIAKIHEAYPQLSIMWLMFGEGSMVADDSERPTPNPAGTAPSSSDDQIRENTVFASASSDDSENQNLSDLSKESIDGNISLPLDFMLDNEPMHDNGTSYPASESVNRPDLTGPLETARNTSTAERIEAKESDRTITFHQEDIPQSGHSAPIHPEGKHVVSIIVYYSDNSYQSFIPDPDGRFPMMH